MQLALCVHRAVVDVDAELGLVKVVELAAVQDVGRIMNRVALEGQIHGGTAQGLGLALMEEIQVTDGRIRNPSFTDYLIPTILDMPPMRLDILEYADPHAPYGLRGAGEPPTLSSTPAIVAAIRNATGLPLRRVPSAPNTSPTRRILTVYAGMATITVRSRRLRLAATRCAAAKVGGAEEHQARFLHSGLCRRAGRSAPDRWRRPVASRTRPAEISGKATVLAPISSATRERARVARSQQFAPGRPRAGRSARRCG